MDDIEFHGEPPSNIPTMVVAFGGWVDAGEAARLPFFVPNIWSLPSGTQRKNVIKSCVGKSIAS